MCVCVYFICVLSQHLLETGIYWRPTFIQDAALVRSFTVTTVHKSTNAYDNEDDCNQKMNRGRPHRPQTISAAEILATCNDHFGHISATCNVRMTPRKIYMTSTCKLLVYNNTSRELIVFAMYFDNNAK